MYKAPSGRRQLASGSYSSRVPIVSVPLHLSTPCAEAATSTVFLCYSLRYKCLPCVSQLISVQGQESENVASIAKNLDWGRVEKTDVSKPCISIHSSYLFVLSSIRCEEPIWITLMPHFPVLVVRSFAFADISLPRCWGNGSGRHSSLLT